MLPVVLVHGLIGHFADDRATALLHPIPFLAPDLLGYGAEADADPDTITIESQVQYLHRAISRAAGDTRIHLVGHSVGGVVANGFTHRFPERVASLVNVEGNFTLDDAFWSARLAAMTAQQVHEMLEADRADPARWLRDGGAEPTSERVRSAVEALAYQPATTIHAVARAVVEFTGRPGYAQLVREVFQHTPVHLVAGARSRTAWHVPDWALTAAASYTAIPDASHMVMLEAPEAFANVLLRLVRDG